MNLDNDKNAEHVLAGWLVVVLSSRFNVQNLKNTLAMSTRN